MMFIIIFTCKSSIALKLGNEDENSSLYEICCFCSDL